MIGNNRNHVSEEGEGAREKDCSGTKEGCYDGCIIVGM